MKDKKIEELKASPWSIGGLSPGSRLSNKVKFTQQELILNKSTDVYLFSDGYMDQFQSGSEVKFSKKRFIELLRSCSRMIQEQQYEIFSQTMNEWIGQSAQMDDMLIIGVRF